MIIAGGMKFNNEFAFYFPGLYRSDKNVVEAAGGRIASLVFGVLIIPVIFAFAKRLFKSEDDKGTPVLIAFFAAILLSLDFLHFVQCRISMLDIFLAFFSLIGFYHIWRYIDEPGHPAVFLILGGIFFGLGTACKWSALFGAGAALLAVMVYVKPWKKLLGPGGEDLKPWERFVMHTGFRLYEIVVFFLLIGIIYFSAFMPYLGTGGNLAGIEKHHVDTLNFHLHPREFKHPYLSPFWKWPLVARPIWYFYAGLPDNKICSGIIAMGSPFFWWTFIPVFLFMLVYGIAKRKKELLLIALGYLAFWLGWIISKKGGFFYYMTPCVPFMALAVAWFLGLLCKKFNSLAPAVIYIFLTTFFFLAFLPILNNYPISHHYYYDYLMWFKKAWI